MKKFLIVVMVIGMISAFCGCGGSDEPTAYDPVDIQVEAIDGEDANVYHVIYDIDGSNTDEWSGFWDSRESETALNGIKECMARDDWTDTSVVYGEDTNSTALYSYGFNGIDGDYQSVKFFEGGMFHKDYSVEGMLD